MWTTLFVMAVMVCFEPIRIGLTVIMLNRPRPMLQLLVFLCGGFVMGLGVGLVVLFVLRHALSSTTNFTVPKVQIGIGLLALLAAATLATNVVADQLRRRRLTSTAVGADTGMAVMDPTPPSARQRLSGLIRKLLQGRSLWMAGIAGLGIAGPSIDYLAALAIILASGAAPATQAGALLAFNVVAFVLVEIPLVSYLVAPDKTRTLMEALNAWIRSRRRQDVAALLAAGGCIMITVGVVGL
jgi:hypothetical protein